MVREVYSSTCAQVSINLTLAKQPLEYTVERRRSQATSSRCEKRAGPYNVPVQRTTVLP